MISDGNSSLWSGDFVGVRFERTSPTSYARTSPVVRVNRFTLTKGDVRAVMYAKG